MSATLTDKLSELRRRHQRAIRARRIGRAILLWLTAGIGVEWAKLVFGWSNDTYLIVAGILWTALLVVLWQMKVPKRVRELPDAWYARRCDEHLRLTDLPLTTASELQNASWKENLTRELSRRVAVRADELANRVEPMKVFPNPSSRLTWGIVAAGVVWIFSMSFFVWRIDDETPTPRSVTMQTATPLGGDAADEDAAVQNNHESGTTMDDVSDVGDKATPNDNAPDGQHEAAGGSGERGEGGEATGSAGSMGTSSAGIILERLNVPENQREHLAALVDAAPPVYREQVAAYMLRIQRDSQ